MYHLTDEDLILHFYGEGGPSEERRIDDHLAALQRVPSGVGGAAARR